MNMINRLAVRTAGVSLALAMVVSSRGFAQSFNSAARGTTAADFLELGVGARADGMGEAYSAVAEGADALYWNPAALTNVQDHAITVMDAPYIDSSYYDSIEYAQKLGPGSLGVGLQYFNSGSIAATDASGVSVGSFDPYDIAFSVGYGYKLNGLSQDWLNGYSVGLAGKWIQSRIATYAQTEAADIGVYSPGYMGDKLHWAFTATNLGGTMKFDSANENLPEAFRVGGSYKIMGNWLGSADLVLPRGNGPELALGTEYRYDAGKGLGIAVRGGYNTTTTDDVTGFTGFSFGAGISFQKYSFDYAVVPYGDLGLTHRLSLSARF